MLSDLQTLQQELLPVAQHWKAIGICLQIDVNLIARLAISPTTEKEDSEYATHHSPEDCLSEILRWWLNRVSPQPTWRAVIDALRSPAVGEMKLANQIHLKYCRPQLPWQQDPGQLNSSLSI